MSAQVPDDVSEAKGAICLALEEFSVGPGARARVQALRDALVAMIKTDNYTDLGTTYGDLLLPASFRTPASRNAIVDYLDRYWFDPIPAEAYFPGVPVAEIHAKGMLTALDLSLAGEGAVIPFESWWMLEFPHFELLSLVRQLSNGTTVSKYVILDIRTPRPAFASGVVSKNWILGKTGQAYVTRVELASGQGTGSVVTTSVRTGKVIRPGRKITP